MSKEEKIAQFDPNGAGSAEGGLYGLPFSLEESEVVVVPVPWEVTVSYSAGTADGPAAILEASKQVDLFDPDIPNAWKLGIAMLDIPKKLQAKSHKFRKSAEKLIDFQIEGGDFSRHPKKNAALAEVNEACEEMNEWVEQTVGEWLDKGKMVALLGGDHSTPLGALKAVAKKHPGFGILHFDAHADLREAFEGFTFSHASIMFNALQIEGLQKLVQVGIRDYCEEESRLMLENPKVEAFTWRGIERSKFEGKSWAHQCQSIVSHLPKEVYISFDIDGLDPTLCPNTGTPVPGGLSFEEACYLIEEVVRAGKTIVGLDLVEVAPGREGEWDANVGSRLLYRMCNWMAKSQGKL